MINYLQKIIDELPEVLRGTKYCPAGDNLFKIRDDEDRELLPKEMARKFHGTTAQLFSLQDSKTRYRATGILPHN